MTGRPMRSAGTAPRGAGTDHARRASSIRNVIRGLALGVLCADPVWAAGGGGLVFTGERPAKIEVGEDGIKTMILTEKAVERIGVETTDVVSGPDGQSLVPISAGVYLPDGSTWVYVEIEEHTYKRAPIDIHDITEAGITLISGPDTGVAVVTAGASEFWGLEDGVGE